MRLNLSSLTGFLSLILPPAGIFHWDGCLIRVGMVPLGRFTVKRMQIVPALSCFLTIMGVKQEFDSKLFSNIMRPFLKNKFRIVTYTKQDVYLVNMLIVN
jgi:hypothetical protein